jgi:hypothetical protein
MADEEPANKPLSALAIRAIRSPTSLSEAEIITLGALVLTEMASSPKGEARLPPRQS